MIVMPMMIGISIIAFTGPRCLHGTGGLLLCHGLLSSAPLALRRLRRARACRPGRPALHRRAARPGPTRPRRSNRPVGPGLRYGPQRGTAAPRRGRFAPGAVGAISPARLGDAPVVALLRCQVDPLSLLRLFIPPLPPQGGKRIPLWVAFRKHAFRLCTEWLVLQYGPNA